MSARAGGHVASVPAVKREGGHVIEMQRRRLLSATGELLAEAGIEGATVGRLTRRAGISRRTFYEVFEDREECYLAAFNEAIERISRDALPVYARERKWNARIRAGLTALLEHLDAHPDVARMCVVETLRAGPKLLERRKRVLDALATVVDEGRGDSNRAGGPPPLTAEGVVGGVLAIVHARLLACLPPAVGGPQTGEDDHRPLIELANSLTGMIVHPYLGPAAARRELDRSPTGASGAVARGARDPFKDLRIRFTYRTARVLATIAAGSGASNRQIADGSGIGDEGQMSRLLLRLQRAGLIENRGEGQARGEPNAWRLTERGEAVHETLSGGAVEDSARQSRAPAAGR